MIDRPGVRILLGHHGRMVDELGRHSGLRRRDRPRASLWKAPNFPTVPFACVIVFSWWGIAAYGWSAVTGQVDPAGNHSRLLSAVAALVCLAIALSTTWLAWLYLRRPVIGSKTWIATHPENPASSRAPDSPAGTRD